MIRRPLSSVDAAWLRMESPDNMMMVTGVLVFGAPMDYDRLKATLEHRLMGLDRFHQRIVRPAFGPPYWEDDPDYDLSYHLQRAALPPPGDQATLQELVSLMASTQLDFSRPLWQLHLVDNYGDGSALICRLHHCIGDGLALVYVLLSLTDTVADTPWPIIQPQRPQRRARRSLKTILRPIHAAASTTRRTAATLIEQYREMREDPSHVKELASLPPRSAAALARLLLLWPDPKTAFKGPLDIPKRAAWSAPIPLRDVKNVGRTLGGTVNDVLLTAMTGALRRYLLRRDQPVDGLNFRAVVPVNLRRPGTEHELGNKFGLVFLSLPVGIADPSERLVEVRRRMDALKDSMEAPVAFGILTTIGAAPEVVQDVVVNIFGLKGTAVMTNVIGPGIKLYMAGAPLEALMFWVPQSGRLGMGVSILSYAGQVWMGIITDQGLVPDPEAIITGFHDELDGLLALAEKARQESEFEQMSAMLEDALTTLDEVAEEETQATITEADAPAHCQALTKAGRPCKNRPLSGSAFCHVHQD